MIALQRRHRRKTGVGILLRPSAVLRIRGESRALPLVPGHPATKPFFQAYEAGAKQTRPSLCSLDQRGLGHVEHHQHSLSRILSGSDGGDPQIWFGRLKHRRATAMQSKNKQLRFDDSAEVLKDAHLRRSADLGRWLREFLQTRREERLARADQRARALPQTQRGMAT
jgi:hypothetical protein